MWMSWTQQKWLPMTGWYGQPRDWWPWYKEAPQPLRQAGCSWQVFQRCWDLKQKNEWVETPFSGPRLPLKQDRVQTPPWQHERALMAWWAWVWVQKGDPKFQAGGEGKGWSSRESPALRPDTTGIGTALGQAASPNGGRPAFWEQALGTQPGSPKDLTGSRRLLLSLLILLLDTVWCNRKPQSLESDRPNFHSWLQTVYALWLWINYLT